MLVAGVTLFAAGCLASALGADHTAGIVLRCAGLALLTAAGVWKRSLTYWMFAAMVIGLEVGLDWPGVATHVKVLSDIFLRLIKVIVAPLIIGTLITGIAGHGELGKVGRIGLKSLIYFEVVTTVALLIGVAAINISQAGVGLAIAAPPVEQVLAPAPMQWDDFVVHVFPDNIVKSVGDNQILQVAVFSILFAIALTRVPEPVRQPVLRLAESLTQTMFSLTNLVMYFAPIGVGAAMAYTVGHMGIGVLLPLGALVLTAYAGLAVFVLGVLVPIAVLARLPLARLVTFMAEPATIAFATSTSEAALPRAMECMEAFGVPRRIVAVVIPAGYSFNLDGSTLYLALASVFVAQASGMHLTWTDQLFMVFVLMLTSKGVAGVPRAVLVVLLATASTFHLPTEPIVVMLGVDALIDMVRTSVNVTGNCLASAVIARWEGELPEPDVLRRMPSAFNRS